jgi:hypothetical protein
MREFNKLSIAKLRPAPDQAKPRSPNMLGTLTLQRATLEALLKQMNDANADEVTCNLAGWFNTDRDGRYLGVQLSERFEKKRPQVQNMTMDEFFHDLKQEQSQGHNGHSQSLGQADKYPLRPIRTYGRFSCQNKNPK